MPAAVRFTVVSQTSVPASSFLAPSALTGFLDWGEEQGSVLNLTLPVRIHARFLFIHPQCIENNILQYVKVALPCTYKVVLPPATAALHLIVDKAKKQNTRIPAKLVCLN